MENRTAYSTTVDLPALDPADATGAQRPLPSLAELQAAACSSGEYALKLEAGRWSALRLVPAAQPAPRPAVAVPTAALVTGGAKVHQDFVFTSLYRHINVCVWCMMTHN